ncbi:glycosyl hydrolase, partial [Paenibacillus sp. KR2-11]
MTVYFDEGESLRYRFGEDDAAMLGVIAGRYVGANPPAGFVWRAFSTAGVLQTKGGLYDLNLAPRFPEAGPGEYAYAAALVWSDNRRSLDLQLAPLGPLRFFLNGSLAYRSSVVEELRADARVTLPLELSEGWNTLWLEAQWTPAGFGCLLGAEEAKVRILNVLAPFEERAGQAGWVFSRPAAGRRFEDGALPDLRGSEAATGLQWL